MISPHTIEAARLYEKACKATGYEREMRFGDKVCRNENNITLPVLVVLCASVIFLGVKMGRRDIREFVRKDYSLDPDSNDLDAVIRLAGEKLQVPVGYKSIRHGSDCDGGEYSASISFAFGDVDLCIVETDHPTADHARLALLNELVERMETNSK